MTPFSFPVLLVLTDFVLKRVIVTTKWQISFSGGFYSDSVAHVDDRCFLCNPGTYVPPENASGRRVLDCQVCPPGNMIVKEDIFYYHL